MSMKSSPHIVHLQHVVEMVLWSPGAIPCLGVIVAWCPGHSWRDGFWVGGSCIYSLKKCMFGDALDPESLILWKKMFFFFQLGKFLVCLLSFGTSASGSHLTVAIKSSLGKTCLKVIKSQFSRKVRQYWYVTPKTPSQVQLIQDMHLWLIHFQNLT